MSIFSLSLLLMSPIIAYATYILLNENRDPLKGFHDDFMRNFRDQQKVSSTLENSEANEFSNKTKKRNQMLSVTFGAAIGLLFIMGASISTIFLLLVTLIVFRYWDNKSSLF